MEEENTTAEATSSGRQGSSSSSSPSKTEQKMLDYFMEFSNSSDENRKKLTRKVKHRINNKRHRQRKQIELDQLRRDVPELEHQLHGLKMAAEKKRTSTAQRSVWYHLAQVEKKKLDESIEERELLQNTIKAHEVLVQLYETQLKKLGHPDHVWTKWSALNSAQENPQQYQQEPTTSGMQSSTTS